jgi:hypothetical protein
MIFIVISAFLFSVITSSYQSSPVEFYYNHDKNMLYELIVLNKERAHTFAWTDDLAIDSKEFSLRISNDTLFLKDFDSQNNENDLILIRRGPKLFAVSNKKLWFHDYHIVNVKRAKRTIPIIFLDDLNQYDK